MRYRLKPSIRDKLPDARHVRAPDRRSGKRREQGADLTLEDST